MGKSIFKKGKKSRNELKLPDLHYIVADDWIDTLGPKAFTAWLKFHTWVDRRDEYRDHDRIPYTLESVAEKLGIKSRATLYNTILIPLWEYHLIELVEYEKSERKSQKPVNIIVYESPRNEHQTEIQPLKKLRDWKKDYGSSAQIFGRKGGRPKKEDQKKKKTSYRLKNKTVESYRLKNKTVTVQKNKPNNVFNNLLINSNNNNKQEKKDVVVVDEKQKKEKPLVNSEKDVTILQEKFQQHFQEKLSLETARELIDIANQHGVHISQYLRSMLIRFKQKNETPWNPVGALKHQVKNNWVIKVSSSSRSKREFRPYDVEPDEATLRIARRMKEIEEEKNKASFAGGDN